MSKRRKVAKRAKARTANRKYRDALEGGFKSPRPNDRRHRRYTLDWDELTES